MLRATTCFLKDIDDVFWLDHTGWQLPKPCPFPQFPKAFSAPKACSDVRAHSGNSCLSLPCPASRWQGPPYFPLPVSSSQRLSPNCCQELDAFLPWCSPRTSHSVPPGTKCQGQASLPPQRSHKEWAHPSKPPHLCIRGLAWSISDATTRQWTVGFTACSRNSWGLPRP